MKEKEVWMHRMRMAQQMFSGVMGKSVKVIKSVISPHHAKRECERRKRQYPSLDLSRFGH